MQFDLDRVITVDPKWYGSRVLLAAHDIVKVLNDDTYRMFYNGRYYIVLNLSEYNTMLSRAVGGFEPRKFKLIEALLPSGGVFLDLGGNKGDFSLFAASIVGDDGKVVCFEPHPDNVKCIELSIEKNGFRNVTVKQVCVADQIGTVTLYIGRASGWHTMFGTSVERGTLERDSVTIDSVTEGFDRVDVMKMDIEGADVLALRGAKKCLARFRPVVAMDVHRRIIKDEGVAEILEMCEALEYSPLEDLTLAPYRAGSKASAIVLVPTERRDAVIATARAAWAPPKRAKAKRA